MKYAAAVLYNRMSPLESVGYPAVTNALLSGGVFLDEVTFLPYDAPASVNSALTRLSLECDALFLIADPVLFELARQAVSAAANAPFSEEYLLETEKCLFGVLPTGQRGAEVVKTEAVPRVNARRKNSYERVILRTVSAPSEVLSSAFRKAEEAGRGSVTLHATEKYGAARIEVLYDRSTPKMTADEVVRILATELSEYLYAVDDVTIAERLVELLKLRRMRISVAESFTGGGVGRALVRVPGASAVYYEGLNVYNEKAKTERLGVTEHTLRTKSAVSDDTAYEMAAGLLKEGNCDLAVATTGYAGPETDRGAPAGLCYLAVGTRERIHVYRYQLPGDRETVTETAINFALFLAYREIK